MASTKYTYSISSDFPNQKVNAGRLTQEIAASSITITLDYINTDSTNCDIWFKVDISAGEQTTLDSIVDNHSGEIILSDPPKDSSGKPRVHQTSRKLGLLTYWTGSGDNPAVVTDVGGGSELQINHEIGHDIEQSVYVDFNCVANETHLHEGYVVWKDAYFDEVSLSVVPRIVTTEAGTDTNYNLYGGYLVIPAAGDGTLDMTSDITQPNGGLVYIPTPGDANATPSPAFWNADFNTSTGLFENITAAPSGDGNFNMFSVEVSLQRFINRIPLLGNGFERLQSADSDEIGQGMRLKLTTTTVGTDHQWNLACIATMHRSKTA